ncbi:hypothetical protein ACLBXM_00910 [Xanthobacteraceae bacterium A53D]
MTWHPPRTDVSPLEAELSRLARALILADPDGTAAPDWHDLALEGEPARAHLAARPRERGSHLGRAVLIYDLSGQVLIGRAGHACTGTAVMDLKTRAFLDVSCGLRPMGRL